MTDPAAGAPVEAGERGRLVIADAVLEKIATIAAAEVTGVLATGSALEGVLGRRYPKATAEVAGQHARVNLDLAVAWPTPLAATAGSVRDRVRSQLQRLTGLDVDAVDVTVAKVVHPEPHQRRRVQ